MAFKTCPECENKCGVRSNKCKNCEYMFPVKSTGKVKLKTKRNGISIDWHELMPQDYVLVSGEGPYYLLENGEKVNMGHSGYFKVVRLDNKGIIGVAANTKCGGTVHIYMSEPAKSKTGTILRPHVVRKVDPADIKEIIA